MITELLIFIVGLFGTYKQPIIEPTTVEPLVVEIVEINENPTVDKVREEIIRQAKLANFSEETALKIATCESNFKWDAKNPKSSAKGVYQFIDSTWEWIEAEGHQFDYKENIKQFLKYYPIYPGWWEECN